MPKIIHRSTIFLAIFIFHSAESSLNLFEEAADELKSEESSFNKQDGSWSQWWSYDGISGQYK